MISLGTWQYSPSVAKATVELGFKVGFNHIDTANSYRNQKGVGEALPANRSSYFLTTKVPGCGLQGISRENCAEDSSKAAQTNLDELGLPYVDLLLIHAPYQAWGEPYSNCSKGPNGDS